jgi:hypothetical protein
MLAEWIIQCNHSFKNWHNIKDIITACDVAISFYLQKTIQSNLEIIKDNDAFLGCNYKGFANETFNCCGEKINKNKIITCHRMTLSDFDDYTNLLETNDYFI